MLIATGTPLESNQARRTCQKQETGQSLAALSLEELLDQGAN